jgi:hypothetical protein
VKPSLLREFVRRAADDPARLPESWAIDTRSRTTSFSLRATILRSHGILAVWNDPPSGGQPAIGVPDSPKVSRHGSLRLRVEPRFPSKRYGSKKDTRYSLPSNLRITPGHVRGKRASTLSSGPAKHCSPSSLSKTTVRSRIMRKPRWQSKSPRGSQARVRRSSLTFGSFHSRYQPLRPPIQWRHTLPPRRT